MSKTHAGSRREEFEALALPLAEILYATAYRMTGHAAQAEDLVQEAFVRAWQNFSRFQAGTNFKAWVFKIMIFVHKNERRSAKMREHATDFSDGETPLEAPPPAGARDPEGKERRCAEGGGGMSDWMANDGFARFVRKASARVEPPAGLRERLRAALDRAGDSAEDEARRQEIHAYLDGQLAPERARELEARSEQDAELAAEIEAQRLFLGTIRKASTRVVVPQELRERLKAGLERSEGDRKAARRAGWRGLLWRYGPLAAAVLLLAAIWSYRDPGCPFLIACSEEYLRLAEGLEPDLKSSDPTELAAYVRKEARAAMPTVPNLSSMGGFVPVGAGPAPFESLRAYHAPAGAFVKYEKPGGEVLTLLFQNWPEETPSSVARREHHGETYWVAEHHGCQVVCWKCPANQVLCVLVCANHTLQEVIAMAEQVRHGLDIRSAKAADVLSEY